MDFFFEIWWTTYVAGVADVHQLDWVSGGANIHQLGGSEASLPLSQGVLGIKGMGLYKYIYIYI